VALTHTCDVCGRVEAARLPVFVGRVASGAGDSEDRYEYIDLCPTHMVYYVRLRLDRGDPKKNEEWLRRIPRKVPFDGGRTEGLRLTSLAPTD